MMFKNRQNGQVIYLRRRENRYPDYFPLHLGLQLLWQDQLLGQGHDDPLCVCQSKHGKHVILLLLEFM